MRKCLRCETEMKEGFGLKIENLLAGVGPVFLSDGQKLLSDGIEKVKVAVCPSCGELSIYVEKIDKL